MVPLNSLEFLNSIRFGQFPCPLSHLLNNRKLNVESSQDSE